MEIKSDLTTQSKIIYNENQEIKNQCERLSQVKKKLETDYSQHMQKIRQLENTLQEEKRRNGAQKSDLTRETKNWQTKEHQFVNELRKKEIMVQSIQDRMRHLTDKENSNNCKNSLELSQVLIKNGPNFYDGNANSEFTQLIGQNNQSVQAKLKGENRLMREALVEIQNSLNEIMKTRKDIMQNKYGSEMQVEGEENEIIEGMDDGQVELRKELLNLSVDHSKMEPLTVVKENVKRFKKFMDKLDSYTFKIPIEKAYQFEPDTDIDEIKTMNKLKDLQKNYKYIVESQDCLINKAIQAGTKTRNDNIDPTKCRMKVLDADGIQRAKEFLTRQKAYLSECNKDFVSFIIYIYIYLS